MENSEIEKELIKYSKNLSREELREVLDFMKFITLKKKTKDDLTDDLSKLSDSQTAHLEEEFKDYKKLYPYYGA